MLYRKLFALFSKKRRRPKVLQMPITSRCNSRCKTCNIWKYKVNRDIDYIALNKALQDPFFSEVVAVGLNGGEITLVPDFIEILKSVLVLPNLHFITLISNGLLPEKLFSLLKESKILCERKGVILNMCLSVDGVGEIHEYVRGVPKCFAKTKTIIEELSKNKERYCDNLFIGCTLSNHNISFIRETDLFFSKYKDLSVEYHLAVPNKRIKTYNDYKDYYILNNEEARFLATEFFYEQYLQSRNEGFRRQQFVNYAFLYKRGHRLCSCDYLNRDVTIDENLDLSLCATASDIIGNLVDNSASRLIRSNATKKVAKYLASCCDNCIHYSYHPLTYRGRLIYINEIIRNKYIYEYYRVRSVNSWLLRQHVSCSLFKHVAIDYIKLLYKYIWKLQ